MTTVAIIGFGNRGRMFGQHILQDESVKLVAVADTVEQIIDVNKLTDRVLDDDHGGGDYFLYKDFIDYITVDSPSFTRTTINDSIECHLMGFKAEESRQKGGIPLEINL